MHETVIAKQLIDAAKKQGKVRSITVEVGDLAHLPLEDLEKTLTEMVDWEVIMIRKKAKVKCDDYEGEPKIIGKGHDFNLFECPACGKVPKIVEGEDIILKKVEIN